MFQSNKELKRNVIFFAGVGAVLLILMMLKWLPFSADWEMALILFGLVMLFYLKRMLWKEEKDLEFVQIKIRAKVFSPFVRS
ncbi:hypothetical protein ACRPLG_14410 [Bacillus safensis]|uniref:hypothetical protein n=1 Tax=Bacillus safensis TaxID=561879 RepID=UPI003D77630D